MPTLVSHAHPESRPQGENQQPPEQPPNDFDLSDPRRSIQIKLFILFGAGRGGSNPHDLVVGGF
jgi:hypothetical protein